MRSARFVYSFSRHWRACRRALSQVFRPPVPAILTDGTVGPAPEAAIALTPPHKRNEGITPACRRELTSAGTHSYTINVSGWDGEII